MDSLHDNRFALDELMPLIRQGIGSTADFGFSAGRSAGSGDGVSDGSGGN